MFHIGSFFSFYVTCCSCSLFLNHLAWIPEGWIICKNNFYELGPNNLYDSVNVIKLWKPIVSHTSWSYKSFNVSRLYIVGVWYSVFLTICENRNVIETWLQLLIKKHASRDLLSFKNSVYKEKCGTFTKWESVKETPSPNNFLRKFKK